MAADWITEGLSRTGLVEVVPVARVLSASGRAAVRAAADSLGMVRALGREMGARIVLSGAYHQRGDSVVFQARLSDASTGALLSAVISAAGQSQAPEAAIELLRQRTMGSLAVSVHPRMASWARIASQPPSFEAYQLYAAAIDRVPGGARVLEKQEFLLRAAALDSSFTAPLILVMESALENGHLVGQIARVESVARVLESRRARLAPWDRAMFDYYGSKLKGQHREAYLAMRRVVALVPNSEWIIELAASALWINRPREVVELLARFDPERAQVIGYPTTYWYFLLAARHLLGDYEGELADVQRMRRTLGESSMASQTELVALAAMGRVDQVTKMVEATLASGAPTAGFAGGGRGRVLDAALELRAHGHPDAAERLIQRIVRWYETAPPSVRDSTAFRMSLAVALFAAHPFEEARPFFERVHAEDTTRWTARGFLAQVAARLEDRVSAEREIQWQLNRAGEYGAGEATVHAAAIAAELGDAERAVNLLRLAISQGFYYTNRGIHRQPQLEVLWTIPAAREVIRPKG